MNISLSDQLTPHFRLREFTVSATAKKLKLSNNPDAGQTENLRALCEHVLEPLRLRYGRFIKVTSGYRCPRLNRAVRGARNSQHMSGEAADIVGASRYYNWVLGNLIRAYLPFDQLIFEKVDSRGMPAWIHVSYRRNESLNRHEVLTTLDAH